MFLPVTPAIDRQENENYENSVYEQLVDGDTRLISLIEAFIEGKSPDLDRCEDRYFVNKDFAVIADGVTSVLPECADMKCSPGARAAEVVVDVVKELHVDSTARQAVDSLTSAIREIPDRKELRAAATVAIYSARRREIWRIGDCKLVIGDEENSCEKLIDSTLSDLRAFLLECELQNGASIESLQENDPGREFIVPAIRRQHQFENKTGSPFAYAVVNGDYIDDSLVEVIAVPDEVREIVLASDGYPQVRSTLNETERELQLLIREDPLLCREFRSTKPVLPGNNSFDDRTYLRIAV